MNIAILVCIKTVPDLSGQARPVPCGRWIDERDLSWCMNSHDAHALEAALAIKDTTDQVRVDALSMGPARVRTTLVRAMAMGADRGIHLAAESDPPVSAAWVAQAIADFAGPKNYDLILTGALSEDLMQGITGPLIASALDLPCASGAVDMTPEWKKRLLTVHCEMEGGLTEIVRLPCPALVTVQTGSNRPRYPSLSNTLRSRHQAIERVVPAVVNRCRQSIEALEVSFPPKASNCQIIEGTQIQKADTLIRLFHDHGWLK